jgi:hypothetical protein
MEYVRDPGQPELVLKAFERVSSPILGMLKVDKKAGEYLLREEVAPYHGPGDQKIVTRVEKNWFPLVESRLKVPRPAGYIIPGNRLDIAELLVTHGIKVEMLEKGALVEAVAYKVNEIVPSQEDYLAPQKIEVQPEKLKVPLKRGDFFVSCFQPAANLIPCLLEPQSEYGLIRYFKFKLIPQEGDYFSIYRLETPVILPLVEFKPWN